ncbi:urease accessory protein UreF [Aurantimonas sp. HBX-1]|uniref:urease accessory protein UreF n=1 Tax=Aurantimonas sp. HBX-1 TaxID=2906072 RepID=UPI001F2B2E95|nr:urease accessory protein UreF [Aurantimonas sp. HBX-1]UIJ72303.1 urease accessory protein UreF [Aurantimonas sp. HBX-1]
MTTGASGLPLPEPAEGSARAALPQLLTLFSPAFPIGGFAWSHGLEAAVAEGIVTDGDGLAAWVALLLDRGSGWNDLVLMAEAFHAAAAGDRGRLASVAELAVALAGSAERRAETLALGAAFAEASAHWAGEGGEPGTATAEGGLAAVTAPCGGLPYPVAAGRLAAMAGLPLAETLIAYAHGFAAALVSAAVRLVPLPQSVAVRVLHGLEPAIADAAGRAARATLDDLGSSALGSDIAAMRHETLHTRLFRS